MSLTSLPPELFSGVVGRIHSQPTLCSLARCSHELYLRTIPHLYRHIKIQEAVGSNAKVRSLTLLLLQRPDLARFVRSFSMHAKYPLVAFGFEPKEFDVHVDQALKIAVKALSLSEDEENSWIGELSPACFCSPDPLLALLLPALPRVQRLDLDFDETHYLERIIGRAARGVRPFDIRPAFQALTVFVRSYSSENIKTEISTGFMASLLKLPAMQIISGSFGNMFRHMDDEDDDLSKVASTSSQLTSLDITEDALSIEDLRHILRAPKALKNFSYTVCPFTPIGFIDLQDALALQKTCLEKLTFDHHRFFTSFAIDPKLDNWAPVPSFVGFSALKVFTCPALFLTNPDGPTERDSLINIFPANLETLHLTRCEYPEDLPDALEHLIAQKSPQQIPLLKNLILENRENQDIELELQEIMQEILSRLFRLGAAHGVSVEYLT